MNKLSKVFIITLLATCFLMNGYSQSTCDDIRYWSNNDCFVEYSTDGFRIDTRLYLSDYEFVFERFDHNKVFIEFGTYTKDEIGNIVLKQDTCKTNSFVKKYKDFNVYCKYFVDFRFKRFISWKIEGDEISFEYILRENEDKTKKDSLKRK